MSKATKVIAITGATGFVGRALVQRLLQDKTLQVRCIVRPGSDLTRLKCLRGNFTFCEADITRPETLDPALDGAWGVINLAGYREFWARNTDEFYEINQRGAENVFQACLRAGVAKVVQVSTPLAFGIPQQLPFDEHSEAGEHTSDYGRSKYLGDKAGWHLHENENLPITFVHLAAVIGAGDSKETMEVRRAVERRLPALVGADTTYTYLYLGDAVEAITRALLKPETVGRSYLIGNQRASTREYFNMIGKLAAVPVPNINIPERWLVPVARAMGWVSQRTGKRPTVPLDVIKTTAAGSLLFNPERAMQELNMCYTPLNHALAESVEEIRGY